MNDEMLQLLVNLHNPNPRQWPWSDEETRKALNLLDLDNSKKIKIADIGCGTGWQTITLAKHTNSEIIAIDLFDDFLGTLKDNASKAGVGDNITTLTCSMDNLPFKEHEFDLIWAEWAIYCIGFENGIQKWKPYIKPWGYVAVSEITWTTQDRPKAIADHRNNEYPEIDTAWKKIEILEKQWFSLVGYFNLQEKSWTTNYYTPIQERLEKFLQENNHSSLAQDIVENERKEVDLYTKYKDFYSYGFYIAQKI